MRDDIYMWQTDFPIKLQERAPDKGSIITLEFDLNNQEINDFNEQIGSKLNGTLPISIEFLQTKDIITITKQGPSQRKLSLKADRIAEFIAKRVDIQYIPAIRTAKSSQDIVEALVERELAEIEGDEKFKQALSDIAALQQPILNALSDKITKTMKEFLPNMVQAKVVIGDQDRSYALRGVSEIVINDGNETALDFKGDGVQSLAAIALMRHASQSQHEGKEVLIALEEPESHLHPSAIRQLRTVLMELSTRHQVMLSTHNPIFTNRVDIHQNIIVSNNKAYPAKSVAEVRRVLGVRLDDNLSSAEIVVIVEGEEDRIALTSIISSMDDLFSTEIKSGRLAFDVLGGAGNLSHRVRMHTEALCQVRAFLDDDREGRTAFSKASESNLLTSGFVNFSVVSGKTEAELEDLYDESVYQEILKAETGFEMLTRGPDAAKKWTERLRNLLRRAGKPIDKPTIISIKMKVAQSAARTGVAAVHKSKIGPIESLTNSLRATLQK